jgi:hypothetical protein
LLRPLFKIKNAQGQTVLRIEGPICTFSMCGSDVKFKVINKKSGKSNPAKIIILIINSYFFIKVMSRDSMVQVGTISKQWSGLLNELLTDADHFC